MNKEEQLEIAAAALARLKSLHTEFTTAVLELQEPRVNGAEFGVDKDELFAICLGVRLSAPHRFIAYDGRFSGIEYTFLGEHEGKILPVWSIYLMPDRRLYLDSAKAEAVCDAMNKYLPSRIAPLLASALLSSLIFSARI